MHTTLTAPLADYQTALAAMRHLDDTQLSHAIHDLAALRGPLGATSAHLTAALDVERERHDIRGARLYTRHTGPARPDNEPGGSMRHAPHTYTHTPRPTHNPATAQTAETQRRQDAHSQTDPRYRIHAHIGGSQHDGYAWAIATHNTDGTPSPHWQQTTAIAEPPKPTATHNPPTPWKGAPAWTDTTRAADVGHSARAHGRALLGADGRNGSVDGRRVRWQVLTADGAAWLHAVAGTVWSGGSGRHVVGAVEVPGRLSTTGYRVVVDLPDGSPRTRPPLDAAGAPVDCNTRAVVEGLPYTARRVPVRRDLRPRQRSTGRSAQVVAATARRRRAQAVADAVACVAVGAAPRSNSRTADAVRAVAAVRVMSALAGRTVQLAELAR